MTTTQQLSKLGFDYVDGEYIKAIGSWGVTIAATPAGFILSCYNYYTEQEFRKLYKSFSSAIKAMDLIIR
ncbi:MAG: hypothetical protein LIO91_03685 [Bacteroidales bacterium]|nr:hypothetical protein [Bacteroidales bacterium]